MKRRKVFWNILISYLVLITLPLLFTGVMFSDTVNGFFKDEILMSRAAQLDSARSIVDFFINSMDANARQMLASSAFSTSRLTESYGNFYDVIRSISAIYTSSTFISDVYYLNGEVKTIYSHVTAFDYDGFLAYSEGAYDCTAEDLDALLLGNRHSYWIPTRAVGSGRAFTYVVTAKRSSLAPTRSMFFQITTQKMSTVLGGDDKNLMILSDSGGQIIYASDEEQAAPIWQHWLAQPQAVTDNLTSITLDGSEYYIYQTDSAVSALKYTAIIPLQEITRTIRAYMSKAAMIYLATAALGAAAIFFFLRRTYQPIRMVSGLAGTTFDTPPSSLDELQIAQQALITMNREMDIRRREKTLLDVLNSGAPILEKQRTLLAIPPGLAGQVYPVVIIARRAGEGRIDMDAYREYAAFAQTHLRQHLCACALPLPEVQAIYLFIFSDSENIAFLIPPLMQLKNVLDYTFNIRTGIGIGEKAASSDVGCAFANAKRAALHASFFGITFQTASDLDTARAQMDPSFDRALDALAHAAAHHVQALPEKLSLLTESIGRSATPLDARCRIYSAARVLLQGQPHETVNEMACLQIDTLEDGYRLLQEIVGARLSGHSPGIVFPQGHEDQNEFGNVMRYILSHYHETTFSIKSYALDLGMSLSNFSHYFKKNTGQTVTEYLALLRFEKARELLRTTNLSVKDIAEKCGYPNAGAMTRQFKQKTGRNPTEYREE